jgi:hypothetical protein
MRVLVCGSRHFTDHVFANRELLKYVDVCDDVIIHGGARGADTLAGIFGKMFGLEVICFPAKWDEHGKAAGPIRNKQMLDEGKPDLVIAFLAPNSRGTKNMIEQAEKAGVPVKIVEIKDDPHRASQGQER